MNLSLLHSWLFNAGLATSFNNVSWSISVELFFYLCFPLLQKKRAAPIAIVTALTSLFVVCIFFQAGMFFRTSEFIDQNPIIRIGEFALGVVSYSVYQRFRNSRVATASATILELTAIGLIALALNIPSMWGPSVCAGAPWALMNASVHMGGAPFYAMLIILFGLCNGVIARALCWRPLVWLGEISFVFYMVHGCILARAGLYQQSFENFPSVVFPTLCFVITLVVASLIHEFVETPFRRVILHHKEHNSAKTLLELVKTSSGSKKTRPAMVLLLLQVTLLAILSQWMMFQTKKIEFNRCKQIVDNSLPVSRNLQFDDRMRLLGIKLSQRKNEIHMTHAWQLSKNQQLCAGTRTEFLNSDGKVIWQHLDAHDLLNRVGVKGSMWEETVKVPEGVVSSSATIRESVFDPILGRNLRIENQNGSECLTFPNVFQAAVHALDISSH